MPAVNRPPIDKLVQPNSVAIIGASEDRGKFGGRILGNLMEHGFEGTILPVNPQRDSLHGLDCYASIEVLPEPADIAVLAIPNRLVLETLEACAARGVGGALVISMGFAEAGEAGRVMQDEITALSRRTGLRIWGPNCMGLIDPLQRLVLTSTYTVHEQELVGGDCALISQSGALMAALFDRAVEFGLRFRFLGSTGNELDVDITELLEYFVEDSETRSIAIYLEGLKRPKALAGCLERAAELGKPVFILKASRTDAGAQAALSHTASLAGSDRVFEGFCAKHGVIRVDDPDQLLLMPALFKHRPKNEAARIALVSGSGGACAIVADQIVLHGLSLAELSARAQASLAASLGAASAANPIDLGTVLDGDYVAAMRQCIRVLEDEADVDVVVFAVTTLPGFAQIFDALFEELANCHKPWVFYSTLGASAQAVIAELRRRRLPLFMALPQLLTALSLWRRTGRERSSRSEIDLRHIVLPPGKCLLTEPQAKALFTDAGFVMTHEELVSTAEEARDAAARVGFPVALKVISQQAPHRARVGGVALGMETREAVFEQTGEIVAAVKAAVPGARIDGILVQRHVDNGTELILGAQNDPQLGPAILLGRGGPDAEQLDDCVVWPVPLDHGDVMAMLDRLKGRALIFDDGAPRDMAALTDTVVRFSCFVEHLGDRLESIDINPLWLLAEGEGVRVGDALIELRPD